MKKLFAVLCAALLLTACGKDGEGIKIAVQEGCDCPDSIKTAVTEYYAGSDVSFEDVKQSDIKSDKYNAAVGYINMTDSLGYGIVKSSVMEYRNVCAAAYDDYRFSDEFSGKNVGTYGDFKLLDYISLPDDCSVTNYDSIDTLLSDFSENAVDAAICTNQTADELKKADSKLRINDIADSNIYEYVVISSDVDLINSIDKVIGD